MSLPPSCARYTAVRLLATGATGAVYLARHLALDRLVAIKVMHAQLSLDSEGVSRFQREAIVTASLTHPHILRVIDHGCDDSVPWIAYEYLPGPAVRQRLSAGPLPVPEALDIGIQIGSALSAAHQRGVLHRDVKPDNVLEVEPGWFKLVDFGIAHWTAGPPIHTRTGALMGTLDYLAPEIAAGQAAHPGSDQYALATMLFECVTGRVPFADDSPLRALDARLAGPAPECRILEPGVPGWLSGLLAKALEREPERRFPDVAAMVTALEEGAGSRRGPRRDRGERPSRRATPGFRTGFLLAAGCALLLAVTWRGGPARDARSSPEPGPGRSVAASGSPADPGKIGERAREISRAARGWLDHPGPVPTLLVRELVGLVGAAADAGLEGTRWMDLEEAGAQVLRCSLRAVDRGQGSPELRRELGRLRDLLKRPPRSVHGRVMQLSLSPYVELVEKPDADRHLARARGLLEACRLLESQVQEKSPEPRIVLAWAGFLRGAAEHHEAAASRFGINGLADPDGRLERRRIDACMELLDQGPRLLRLAASWPRSDSRMRLHVWLWEAAATVAGSPRTRRGGSERTLSGDILRQVCESIEADLLTDRDIQGLARKLENTELLCDRLTRNAANATNTVTRPGTGGAAGNR